MLDDHLRLPGEGALAVLEGGEVDMGHVREEQGLPAGRVVIRGNGAGAVVAWRHCAGSILGGSDRAGPVDRGGEGAGTVDRGGDRAGAVLAVADIVRVELAGVRHPGEVAQQLIDRPGTIKYMGLEYIESEKTKTVWQLDKGINYKLCYVMRSLT